ncbi:MAG: FkbM family methyltransferase [Candidatus Puniceispirillaceae bacterium]
MSTIEDNILACHYEQGIWHKLYYRQSQNLHKRLVSDKANFYLKPNDIISHRPSLFGYHEPHLEHLYKLISKTHYDFFLDIGANIGLSSVLSGTHFTDIHCVEPNLTLSKILDVNIELAGLSERTTIHNIGLGLEDKTEKLFIPRDNFGGAFIKQGNAYDGSNDNLDRDKGDYIIQDIHLKHAGTWLKDLFKAHKTWQAGLIKIDVEGLELPIFKAILSELPKGVSVTIVMENFLKDLNRDQFASSTHDLHWFGFYKKKHHLKSLLFKLMGMSSYYQLSVEKIDTARNAPHDIIVTVTPQ